MKMGSADLSGLMLRLGLLEIGAAEMIVGDVAILPGDEAFDAITICAGNKFMGFHAAGEGFQMIADVLPHVKSAFRL